jgi:hypothetical protein
MATGVSWETTLYYFAADGGPDLECPSLNHTRLGGRRRFEGGLPVLTVRDVSSPATGGAPGLVFETWEGSKVSASRDFPKKSASINQNDFETVAFWVLGDRPSHLLRYSGRAAQTVRCIFYCIIH